MLSTTGLRLAKLSGQVSAVSAENGLLEEEIVKLSSLSRISLEAANLGFTRPSLVVNLTPEVPVALR
jgi:cell division protein FtsL